MAAIYAHIANATGELDHIIKLIYAAFDEAKKIATKELKADQIDIIFVSAPTLAMPEYGIGGNSAGPNHIYISFDPSSKNITKLRLFETLLHELHHCMRWRTQGYGDTLGEAMISEGMACLYEQEHAQELPIYAKVKLSENEIAQAKELLNAKSYDHNEWFFGSKNIPRWFGYTYGYMLCQQYAEKNRSDSIKMIDLPASTILHP